MGEQTSLGKLCQGKCFNFVSGIEYDHPKDEGISQMHFLVLQKLHI